MTPSERLAAILVVAEATLGERSVVSAEQSELIDYVCHCLTNRAGVRLFMACLLAKLDRPEIDPRKPYTKIGTPDSFSGRSYDEQYITYFVSLHRLPCNPTTAFLTPTLRNLNRPITPDFELIGTPRRLYADAQLLLDAVAEGRESAQAALSDVVRVLVRMRDDRLSRLTQLQTELRAGADAMPLSAEAIVKLIRAHLDCGRSSRLPVLVIASALVSTGEKMGERVRPLHSHNAADSQTGALGDVEVTLTTDDRVRAVYEMKQKSVTRDDLDSAIQKISSMDNRPEHYVFISTDRIDPSLSDYAATLYESTGGTEFVVLDCLGFLRHYLQLFHRRRGEFLDAYQSLILGEPDSAVGLPLKEAFLALRAAAAP